MLILRRSKLHYTASGIITPLGGRPVHRLREDSKHVEAFTLLTPNVNYSGRTAPLTSKVAFYIFIQQI